MLIGHGLSLHHRDTTTLGLTFAGLAVLSTGWVMRTMLRLPEREDGLAELMGSGDPFQSVGFALTQTAPFEENRLVLNLESREGSLHAGLEGSRGPLPVPQVVLAAARDLAAHLQKQGKQLVPMRWTVTRQEGGDWAVNLTF